MKGLRLIIALFGLVTLVIAFFVAATSGIVGSQPKPSAAVATPTPQPVKLQIQGTATGQTVVGQSSFMQFVVVNDGPTVNDLGFNLHDGQQDWLDQHTITNPGDPCSVATNPGESGWLVCGPVKTGATVTIRVNATATTAGSFTYQVPVADLGDNPAGAQYAEKPDGGALVLSWSEKILAA